MEQFACLLAFPEVDSDVPNFISQSSVLLLEWLVIGLHFKNYFSLCGKVIIFLTLT